MRKVHLILIAFITVVTSCNTSSNTSSGLRVIEDSIIIKDTYCEVEAYYVRLDIDGLDDSLKLNSERSVNEFVQFSHQIPDTFYRPYTLNISQEINGIKGKVASVLVSDYRYTGGAHGNTFYKVYNYSLKAKSFWGLNDIIQKGTFAELRELVRKKLKAQLDFNDFVDEGTELPEDFANFIITPKSVIFVFGPYAVAPYASGTQRVEIAKEEFQFTVF